MLLLIKLNQKKPKRFLFLNVRWTVKLVTALWGCVELAGRRMPAMLPTWLLPWQIMTSLQTPSNFYLNTLAFSGLVSQETHNLLLVGTSPWMINAAGCHKSNMSKPSILYFCSYGTSWKLNQKKGACWKFEEVFAWLTVSRHLLWLSQKVAPCKNVNTGKIQSALLTCIFLSTVLHFRIRQSHASSDFFSKEQYCNKPPDFTKWHLTH